MLCARFCARREGSFKFDLDAKGHRQIKKMELNRSLRGYKEACSTQSSEHIEFWAPIYNSKSLERYGA